MKPKKYRFISMGFGLFALGAGMAAPALADDGMSYNYIEAAYVDTEIDDGLDVDGDGLLLNGSVELGENFFLTAGYGTQEFDFSVDLDQWAVGIGGHAPITDKLDFVASLSYIDAEVDTPFGDIEDDGYGAGVGLRGKVTDNIELEGGVNYVDLDDGGDDTSFAFGGRYYFTENFALGAGVEFGDDVTSWQAGVRVEF